MGVEKVQSLRFEELNMKIKQNIYIVNTKRVWLS